MIALPGSKPAVSIIMATYNGAAFIEPTIRSVLNQRFEDYELIIVDDCSADRTVPMLQSYGDARIRLLSTPHNAGPVAARNMAAGAARGRYIAALDQDDLSHPARLGRQVAFLDANPNVAVLGTAARRLADGRLRRDRLPRRTSPGLMQWMLHVHNPLVWSSVMIRAEAASLLPVFSRGERQFAEDFDLYHRLRAHGEIARLDEVLTTYRVHPNGASRTHQLGMLASAAAVLEDAYRQLGLPDPERTAELMTRHVAGRQPVGSLALLRELRTRLATITRHFAAHAMPDAGTLSLIAAEERRIGRALTRNWLDAELRARINAVRPDGYPAASVHS